MPTLAPKIIHAITVKAILPADSAQATAIIAAAATTGAPATIRRLAAIDAPALTSAAIDQARLIGAAT